MKFVQNGPVILDGAMGSLLIAKGMKSGDVPEIWNVEHRSDIQDIHTSYLDSGADAILTNSFGATPLRLHESNLRRSEEHTSELQSH